MNPVFRGPILNLFQIKFLIDLFHFAGMYQHTDAKISTKSSSLGL